MNATEKIVNQEIARDISQVILISLWAEWCVCPHIGIAWWKTDHANWKRTYLPNGIHLGGKLAKATPDLQLVAFLERGSLDADHRQYFQWLKVSEDLIDKLDNGDTSLFWGHISGDASKGTASFHWYTRENFCEERKFPPEDVCVFTVSHNLKETAKQWLAQIEARALQMLIAGEVWDVGSSPLVRFIKTNKREV